MASTQRTAATVHYNAGMAETSSKPKRRAQFSLRDLLWLIAVAALAVGWWIDCQELTTTRRSLHQSLKRLEVLERENAKLYLEVTDYRTTISRRGR